jgi:hypothetical protein
MRRLIAVTVIALSVGFAAGAYSKTRSEPVEHQGC